MTPELQDYLTTEINTHSNTYIRNLVASENAVLAGQFNIAEILRAAAYTQRTLALNATRILSDYQGGNALFDSIKREIQNNLEDNLLVGESKKLQRQFEQNEIVQQRLDAIIQKSLQSLPSGCIKNAGI